MDKIPTNPLKLQETELREAIRVKEGNLLYLALVKEMEVERDKAIREMAQGDPLGRGRYSAVEHLLSFFTMKENGFRQREETIKTVERSKGNG